MGKTIISRHTEANNNRHLKEYIEYKIKILKKDFCLNLTDDEVSHFYTLTGAHAVDKYARDLIMEKL